jgi:sulfate permease, SulP family
MIGFIPVNVVGTLIFMLGIELLEEAVWDPFGKLHILEYLTVSAPSKISSIHLILC